MRVLVDKRRNPDGHTQHQQDTNTAKPPLPASSFVTPGFLQHLYATIDKPVGPGSVCHHFQAVAHVLEWGRAQGSPNSCMSHPARDDQQQRKLRGSTRKMATMSIRTMTMTMAMASRATTRRATGRPGERDAHQPRTTAQPPMPTHRRRGTRYPPVLLANQTQKLKRW